MLILRPILELFVVFWATWVVVFQLAIATRIPTRWLPLLFLVALAAALLPWLNDWRRSLAHASTSDRRLVLELVVVATLLSTLVLVTSRFDADDLGYLRGPLIDAAAPDEPIRVDRFSWADRPWPALSLVNENEALEPFVVMTSRLVGLDPVVGYHNVFVVFSVFAWCAVLAGLLAHFRVPRRWIAFGVVVSACLLFFDGGTHRSFGNMTLIRLWQGKIVAWAVVLPLFVLLQLRFLARPRLSRFVLVVMAAMVGVAFNRSMVVMLVVAGTAVPIAYGLAFGARRHRLRRVIYALAAPAPGWLLGGLVALLVWQASPEGISGALDGWTTTTTGAAVAFARVTGGEWAIVARDLLLLGFLPLVALTRPLGKLLAAFSGVTALISFAPPISGLLSMALGPTVWRLYYVLPIPLCLGLLVLVFRTHRETARSRTLGRVFVAGLIAILWANHGAPVLSPDNRVEWKAPLDYRFPSGVRELLEVAGPRFENHRILAAEPVAVALGLTHFDSVELISTRADYARKGRIQRVRKAGRALAKCRINKVTIAALRKLLAKDAELVVSADCGDSAFADLNQRLPGIRLEALIVAGGYRLFRVQPETPPEMLKAAPIEQ